MQSAIFDSIAWGGTVRMQNVAKRSLYTISLKTYWMHYCRQEKEKHYIPKKYLQAGEDIVTHCCE